MPYSGPDDDSLPEYVRDLGEKDRAQWVAIWNGTYATCMDDGGEADACETKAFKTANGVVMADSATLNCFRTNFSPTLKTGTMDGRAYVIAPVVAIVAGVLNGELVPAEELKSGYQSWNGRPLVLGHPETQGVPVSANNPALVGEQIGQLFNVRFQADRLIGEAWIDTAKASASIEGQDLLRRLQAGEVIEVSTAYFRELEEATGEYNGEQYYGIARDLKPDHLAILLDAVGACSVADGCGLPRINTRRSDNRMAEINQRHIKAFTSWVQAKVTANELEPEASLATKWDSIVNAFYAQVDAGIPVADQVGDGMVLEVFESYVVIQRMDSLLFAVDYTIAEDNQVTFSNARQVQVQYVEVAAAPAGEEPEEPETEEPEEMKAQSQMGTQEAPTADKAAGETETTPEPATNAQATPTPMCQKYRALAEWVEANMGADAAMAVLIENQNQARAARTALLDKVAQALSMNAEDLASLPTPVLEKMVANIAAPKPNYAGLPDPLSQPADKPVTVTLPPMRI